MSNKLAISIVLIALGLTACNSVETKTTLVTPVTQTAKTAGPGDVVMRFQSRRSLPNAFGQADVFGRTTNAGSTTVRYVGTRGGKAIFERTDTAVSSDATTISEAPLVLPQTTRTNLSGTVGATPVSGTATSTSFRYIPARGSSQHASASRPITLSLGAGQSVKISGRMLRVVRIGAVSVDYRIE